MNGRSRTEHRRVGTLLCGALTGIAPAVVIAATSLVRLAADPSALRRSFRPALPLLGAGVLVAIPDLVRGDLPRLTIAFSLAAMALGIGNLGDLDERHRTNLVFGCAGGVAVGLGIATWQVYVAGAERALPWPWDPHPNLYGHTLLALAGSAILLTRSGQARWILLGAALVGVAMAGSRAALGGLAIVLLGAIIGSRLRWFAAALILTLFVLLTIVGGATRIGLVVPSVAAFVRGEPPSAPTNHLIASEHLDAPPWRTPGTRVARVDAPSPGTWRLERVGGGRDAGVRQLVVLQPATPYAMSGEFRLETGTAPGFLGRRSVRGDLIAAFSATVEPGGSTNHEAVGPIRVRAVESTDMGEGWWRMVIIVSHDAEDPLPLAVGPVVDRTGIEVGPSVVVRRLQLEQNDAATSYREGTRAAWDRHAALRSASERRRIWSVAWSGFAEHPLFGERASAFQELYLETARPSDAIRNPPTHAHNLALHLMFGWGIFGIAALVLLAGTFGWLAWLAPGSTPWWVIAAFGAANAFDVGLIYAGVLLPLAFAFGVAGSLRSPGSDSSRSVS